MYTRTIQLSLMLWIENFHCINSQIFKIKFSIKMKILKEKFILNNSRYKIHTKYKELSVNIS